MEVSPASQLDHRYNVKASAKTISQVPHMEPTAYPKRPLTEADKLWWISFIAAWGQRKPDGITGMQWASYRVMASSRGEALSILRDTSDIAWDVRCVAYLELLDGADIRICDFDLSRRLVLDFDPNGLDPIAGNFHAIVLECPLNGDIVIPPRYEAYFNRESASRLDDDFFQRIGTASTRSIDDLPLEIRSRIRIRRGCWRWQGSTDYRGYGRVRYDGRSWASHRLIYTLLRVDIPAGAVLRHLCHCANCCNPDHLVPGTNFSNRMDEGLKPAVRKLLRQAGLSPSDRLSQLRALYDLE